MLSSKFESCSFKLNWIIICIHLQQNEWKNVQNGLHKREKYIMNEFKWWLAKLIYEPCGWSRGSCRASPRARGCWRRRWTARWRLGGSDPWTIPFLSARRFWEPARSRGLLRKPFLFDKANSVSEVESPGCEYG